MKDIARKVDRLKELIARTMSGMPPTKTEQIELAGYGVDAISELIANSRRIAVALEKLASTVNPDAINLRPYIRTGDDN